MGLAQLFTAWPVFPASGGNCVPTRHASRARHSKRRYALSRQFRRSFEPQLAIQKSAMCPYLATAKYCCFWVPLTAIHGAGKAPTFTTSNAAPSVTWDLDTVYTAV